MVRVIATDADRNRSILYSLEGGSKVVKLVQVDNSTGQVVVLGRVDRETIPWLNFTIRATDSGVPSRSSVTSVRVQVLDENDNTPVFINTPAKVVVKEDAKAGHVVTMVHAEDKDSGEYGKVRYFLDPSSSDSKFLIDSITGRISVAAELDRETKEEYTLLVQAYDNYQYGFTTGDSRNSFVQIKVVLADVNDSPPVMEEVPTSCTTITEFHPTTEPILRVRATDKDDPKSPNGRVVFSIVQGDGEDLFRLEAGPGKGHSPY